MLSRHAVSPDDLWLLDGDASEMGNSGCCSAVSDMVVQGQDALGAFERELRRRSLSYSPRRLSARFGHLVAFTITCLSRTGG